MCFNFSQLRICLGLVCLVASMWWGIYKVAVFVLNLI